MEGASARGRNGGKWGVGGMGVYFIGLASSAASDEFTDEGGHAGPPVVLLEQGDGAEVSAMGASEGFVDALKKRVMSGFRDVKAALVVEGALVKVPILGRGAG